MGTRVLVAKGELLLNQKYLEAASAHLCALGFNIQALRGI